MTQCRYCHHEQTPNVYFALATTYGNVLATGQYDYGEQAPPRGSWEFNLKINDDAHAQALVPLFGPNVVTDGLQLTFSSHGPRPMGGNS